MAKQARFTVYDMMDAKGLFDTNPANVSGRDSDGRSTYSGPVEFPKMLYHPKGECLVVVPAQVIDTPRGPKEFNEQKELISKLVYSKQEELLARQEGWHLHPADSVVAGGGKPVAKSAQQLMKDTLARSEEADAKLSDAEKRIKELEAQLAALASPAPSGKIKLG